MIGKSLEKFQNFDLSDDLVLALSQASSEQFS